MAVDRRTPLPGLVHHSDRGSQYASRDYTELLQANKIRISMSRRGNPWHNAVCESFIKTLKYEEVYRNEYRDLVEARASIGTFLENLTDADLQQFTSAVAGAKVDDILVINENRLIEMQFTSALEKSRAVFSVATTPKSETATPILRSRAGKPEIVVAIPTNATGVEKTVWSFLI
jgi:hypothetical protein